MYVERFTAVYTRLGVTTPPNQDVMTMSIHFVNKTTIDPGTPTALNNTIRAAVEARWDTFETAWKAFRQSYAVLASLVWANAFPAGSPPHPAVRTQSRSSAGTGGGAAGMPPQCVMNCTLETSNRRHWGRFALGGLTATGVLDDKGNIVIGTVNTVQAALATFLNGCITDGAAPVVYKRPTYNDKAQTSVASIGTYYPVTGCRMDMIVDIVRRRRYEHTQAAQRAQSNLTAPAAAPTLYVGPKDDTRG